MSTDTTDGTLGGGEGRYADDARRYRLDSRIATGGMGEVWRGTDTVLGREVAVKLLKTEYADDPTFRTRFETEAQHAASLHHPGVAAVYDFGEARPTDGSGVPAPYLVMELVDGQPLSALLRGGRSLDPDVARDLLAQAADAIGAAHSAGIVHRDVKPANLLVTPDRRVKITDFGIARATEGLALTQTGQVMGTPQYLSPEQARGNTATPSSDVYSLGVVAFECLAGRRPFSAESPVATALAHLNDPVPDLPPEVPADLAAVVRRAMAKDPRERFPDAASFAAALRNPSGEEATQVVAAVPAPVPPAEHTQVLAAAVPDPTPTPVPPPVQPPVQPPAEPERQGGVSPWLLLLLFVVLAAVVVAVVLLLTRSGDDTSPSDDATTSAPATPSDSAPTEPTEPTSEPTQEETIDLDSSDYVGRNVDDVAQDLRDQGLRVRTEAVDNPDGEDENTVESLTPTSDLQQGETVTVRFWGPEPEPSPTPTPTPTPSETPSPSASPSASASSSPSPSASGSTSPAALPSDQVSQDPGTPAAKETP